MMWYMRKYGVPASKAVEILISDLSSKPRYYKRKDIRSRLRTWEDLFRELQIMFTQHPELERNLPTADWLKKSKSYKKINNAIRKHHGGYLNVRRKLGQEVFRRKADYWENFDNLRHEFGEIDAQHPELNGVAPTYNWLRENGYSYILGAIQRYYGGLPTFREKLREYREQQGLPLPQRRKEPLELLLEGYVGIGERR